MGKIKMSHRARAASVGLIPCIAVIVLFLSSDAHAQNNQVYLSDLNPTAASTSGYGPIERDTSNGEAAAGDGQVITLNGATYTKGLGVHADSAVHYDLSEGGYTRFIADIGVDDEVGGNGSVVFQVWADGSKLFESGVLGGNSPVATVDVDITNRSELVLVVNNGGDNYYYDHADWAGARLIKAATTPGNLPAPWTGRDIGAVGVAGNSSYANNVFIVNASGADIWDRQDSFHFISQELAGDGQIVAHVANLQNTHSNAKAGVMMRENFNADARFAMMNVTPTAGLEFIRRLTPGATTPWTGGGESGSATWLKLTRRGNTISAYKSTDGATWTLVGADTIAMANSVQIGLIVTAHNNSVLANASFDNVAVTSGGTSVTSQSDAVRLLGQATFGPTDESIAHVQDVGASVFLDEQFAAPASTYQDFAYYPPTAPSDCTYDGSNPTGPSTICNRDNYSLFQMQLRFFQNALTGNDQLRQRVAFALGQILVVSGTELAQPSAMSPYQRILLQDAFGNYRQALADITLNPAMGKYLDMVNNDKPNPTTGTEPNENYARELLQLFSIGTVRLNNDGTPQTDARGKPVPAYDQDTVEGLAHVLTGWTYPTKPGSSLIKHNPQYYVGPMVSYPSNHDTGTKQLLNGVVLPAGQTPEKDLNDALDNIFNHPNVGPFICKQLIQHLVTSNPSSAYVNRVADVFNNNGAGVRGDLRAVVRAILLDAEARGDVKTESDYGHLQEPAFYILKVLRAVGGRSDGVYLRGQSSAMGENVFYAPSVFNFYPPDYTAPGTNILGPEFGIQNAATALSRANFVNAIVFANSGIAPDPTVVNAIGTTIDLTALQALAANPPQLLDRLNTVMMHGTMSAQMRDSVARAIAVVPSSDPRTRARTAVYLVATSAQFQVER